MDIKLWLEERLFQLNENEFEILPHQIPPETCKKNCEIKFFSLPLASGTGKAVFAAPKKQLNQKNILVLNFHGLGEDCTYPYWHWLDTLTSQGLNVLSIEWDGHGLGGDSFLDFAVASRTIPLILQKLFGEKSSGSLNTPRQGPNCYLLGHSTGAILTLLAASNPALSQIIKGVISISPTLVINDKCMEKNYNKYFRLRPWFGDVISRLNYYGFNDFMPVGYKKRCKEFPLRTRTAVDTIFQLRVFAHETFSEMRVLKQVKVPILWLHSAKDKLSPLEKIYPLMNEIPSALFTHIDEKRTPRDFAYSTVIPKYIAKFINYSNN